jgi:hypothetical protein
MVESFSNLSRMSHAPVNYRVWRTKLKLFCAFSLNRANQLKGVRTTLRLSREHRRRNSAYSPALQIDLFLVVHATVWLVHTIVLGYPSSLTFTFSHESTKVSHCCTAVCSNGVGVFDLEVVLRWLNAIAGGYGRRKASLHLGTGANTLKRCIICALCCTHLPAELGCTRRSIRIDLHSGGRRASRTLTQFLMAPVAYLLTRWLDVSSTVVLQVSECLGVDKDNVDRFLRYVLITEHVIQLKMLRYVT